MHLVLRCDAAPDQGVGHVVRSLAIAEAAIQRGWQVTMSGSVDVELARGFVDDLGVPVVPPPLASSELIEQAVGLGADVLHIDSYAVERSVRPGSANVLVSSVEDGTFGRRPADVVIDPTPGAESDGRPDDGSGRALLGVRYGPMRSSVRRLRAVAPPGASGVLVVMGGTDPFGATTDAVRLAAKGGAHFITVVSSVVDSNALAEAAGGAEVRVLGPRRDLLDIALEHELVVTAAGTSVWEFAAIGVPTAMICVTANQLRGYDAAMRCGIAVGLGSLEQVRSSEFAGTAFVSELISDPGRRAGLSASSRQLVDGDGASRILDAWTALLGDADGVQVRRARQDDGDLLLEWRNDPASRSASRATGEVNRREHDAWFAAILSDPDRLLLVAEHGGVPVGTVRFDKEAPEVVEVSLTLAPVARGRGLGRLVLSAGEAYLRGRPGAMPSIRACIRPENEASVRLFVAAGYRPIRETRKDGLLTFHRP
ncbi:GNAT family N-acetyltransferase [Cellulomonas sp. P5_C6]